MAGALKNALGHGEMLNMGYNSPIAGQEGHTVSAKLFLPSLFRAPVTGTLEAIMDTVRGVTTADGYGTRESSTTHVRLHCRESTHVRLQKRGMGGCLSFVVVFRRCAPPSSLKKAQKHACQKEDGTLPPTHQHHGRSTQTAGAV